MSYEETQEMAESGAKVLNAQAVEFAKEKGIAIYARATAGPLPGVDPSSDGTVVRKSPPRMPGTVVGVASEKDVLILDYQGTAEDLLGVLDERGVSGKQLHIFGDRTTLAVSRENLHNEPQLREALRATLGDRARIVDGMAAVSVIGAGINATYAKVRTGSETLSGIGATPRGIATSSFRITWMIPVSHTEQAVRALHGQFIEAEQPLLP
jgi:aspartate kinase